MFGEDVARKGGVYGVTRGLQKKAGSARVFDTLLDEQAILGLALGAGVSGLLPIPEIQYLAYLHNAADQIRGEGATLQFFSDRQYRNPMVVRVAGYGYQKGFGGHFHNDNAVAALRDIPGIVVASPARPDDAAAMLRTVRGGRAAAGAVCVFLEPIALYHTRDLHEDGDDRWLARTGLRRAADTMCRSAAPARYGDGTDLTIVTFGNGVRMSLRVARRLERTRHRCPRGRPALAGAAAGRTTSLAGGERHRPGARRRRDPQIGGVSRGCGRRAGRRRASPGRSPGSTSDDSFIPLGDAALQVLLSEDTIEAAAIKLVRAGQS